MGEAVVIAPERFKVFKATETLQPGKKDSNALRAARVRRNLESARIKSKELEEWPLTKQNGIRRQGIKLSRQNQSVRN
jgi:hypothetical protein